MSYPLHVLQALAQLHRRRVAVSSRSLIARAGGDPFALGRAVSLLEQAGLIRRCAGAPRLTMEGLAVALAFAGRGGRRAHGKPRALPRRAA